MADNIMGTNVASMITPYTKNDKYATHDAKYGKGGRCSADTLVDRNNIPFARRDKGMECFVVENSKTYELIKNPIDSNTTQDSDWRLSQSSADAVIFSDGDSLQDKLTGNKLNPTRLCFVISTVRLGPLKTEFLAEGDCSLVKIAANLKSDSIVSDDLSINVECKRSGVWVVAGSIVIPKNNTSSIKNLSTGFKITDEYVRLNVVSGPTDLSNLVVIVSL